MTILSPSRDAQDEAEIRRRIESVDLPASVVEYRIRMGYDWTDDPAAYILFILDEALSDEEFQQDARNIRQATSDLLWDADLGRIPYVRFRNRKEQQEIEKKGYQE